MVGQAIIADVKSNKHMPFQKSWLNLIFFFFMIAYFTYRNNSTYMHRVHDYVRQKSDECYKEAYDKLINRVICPALENPTLNEKVAGQLTRLVEIPKIKRLMTDLTIRMLHDDGFNKNTSGLLYKVIVDYLHSDHCFDKTTVLVKNEIMRNPDIQTIIMNLLLDYLRGDDMPMLMDKLEGVFHSILQRDNIQKYVKDNVHAQLQESYENEFVINSAIDGARGYFK